MDPQIGNDVTHAAQLLKNGKLVAFATETVYGLGANALDVEAVARVFAAKNRPHFDPLIVHIADRVWLDRLVSVWPEKAERLSRKFWPGPLTLIVPKADLVADLVTSGLPSVAIRMPAHPLALELLRQVDLPIVGPSANPFGQLSPTSAEHVAERLGDQIDYILDGGPCSVGVESTVVLIDGDNAILMRPGGIPLEEIEAVIGSVSVPERTTTHPDEAAPSPGMLPQHYAPRTPLTIVDDFDHNESPDRVGALMLCAEPDAKQFAAVEVLSQTGDLTEAAAKFFAALRRLDAAGVSRIVARKFPNHGLGRALNDRLSRAATK